MELHWGRLMRCYVERPPTLDAMIKAAVAESIVELPARPGA
jgi:hypothetical protein